MGMSIEKFKMTEKIKLSYLRHRGNVTEVVEETGYPMELVKKAIAKIKKQGERNVAVLISNTLMSHLMLGYESRVTNLMAMVKNLEGRDRNKVSICCDSPVRRIITSEEYGHEDYECLECGLRAEIKILDKESILNIKIKLFEQLREEDKCLTEFADKMGYTNRENPPPPIIQKNNVLVIKSDKGSGMTDKDTEIVQDYSKLPPMERERHVEKLRNEIIDIDGQIEQNTRAAEEKDSDSLPFAD